MDRHILADMLAIFVIAILLYAPFMLRGPGWGGEARLQTEAVVYFKGPGPVSNLPEGTRILPFALFNKLLPFGAPATRTTLFCLLLSASALPLFYAFLRLFITRRSTASMGVIALGLSQSWFLHSVRPSFHSLTAFLFTLMLLLAARYLLLRGRILFATLWLTGLAAAAAGFVPWTLIVPLLLFATIAPRVGAGNVMVLFGFLAAFGIFRVSTLAARPGRLFLMESLNLLFQFPIAGWLLGAWGLDFLRRRSPSLTLLLLLGLLSAIPHADSRSLPLADLLGLMLPASVPFAAFVAAGAERVRERFGRSGEAPAVVSAALLGSVALLPVAAIIFLLHAFQTSSLDRMFVEDRLPFAKLKRSAWHDEFWYTIYPPKNGEGSSKFIAELEGLGGDAWGCTVFMDESFTWPLSYAMHVEGRNLRGRPALYPPSEQLTHARWAAADGRRVFLAGTAPESYDIAGLGKEGHIMAVGRFYEWVPFRNEKTH